MNITINKEDVALQTRGGVDYAKFRVAKKVWEHARADYALFKLEDEGGVYFTGYPYQTTVGRVEEHEEDNHYLLELEAPSNREYAQRLVHLTHASLPPSLWKDTGDGELIARLGDYSAHIKATDEANVYKVFVECHRKGETRADFAAEMDACLSDIQRMMEHHLEGLCAEDRVEGFLKEFRADGSNGKSALMKAMAEAIGPLTEEKPEDINDVFKRLDKDSEERNKSFRAKVDRKTITWLIRENYLDNHYYGDLDFDFQPDGTVIVTGIPDKDHVA